MTKPITVRGVEYKSRSEAALALGVSISQVRKSEKKGRLDFLGLGKIDPSKKITILGVEYKSRREAAKALGLTPSEMANVSKYPEFLEFLAKKVGAHNPEA